MKKKYLALVVAIALVLGCVVGGTVAWLTANTNPLVNTFTAGNIDITLAETTTAYKMVPGETIAKDPKVTVEAGSEACWLFVKVDKSTNYGTYLNEPAIIVGEGGWTKLEGVDNVDNVYYRKVAANVNEDQPFQVLVDNKVTVNEDVTKEQMDNITNKTVDNPTLTFTAYAIQQSSFDTALAAWTEISTPAL